MHDKTVRELIEALEALEGEFGDLPLAVCSVATEWMIAALVVSADEKRVELQIVRATDRH